MEHKPDSNLPLALDPSQIDNAVLRRLIQEVKYEQENNINSYNRIHNRHNRTPYPKPAPIETPDDKNRSVLKSASER
jgi:hypothetical protein